MVQRVAFGRFYDIFTLWQYDLLPGDGTGNLSPLYRIGFASTNRNMYQYLYMTGVYAKVVCTVLPIFYCIRCAAYFDFNELLLINIFAAVYYNKNKKCVDHCWMEMSEYFLNYYIEITSSDFNSIHKGGILSKRSDFVRFKHFQN